MSIHVFSLPAKCSKFNDAYPRLSQHFQQICSLYIAIKDHFIKSYDLWNHKTLEILIAIILVLLFVIRFWTTSFRTPTKDSQRARTALQALQTVLVPSCSLWPARYIKLVKHTSNHRTGSRIVVPLSMFLQDVCDGVIELRDPLYDLEDLIDQGVRAYGCSVSLKVEWKWWVEWLDRMLRVNASDMESHDGVDSSNFAVISAQHIDWLIHPLTTAPPPSTDHGTVINLDIHPLTHLATIQLPKGSRTTLEFTSLSNHISFLSTKHILCLIPFLAHRLPSSLSDVLATVNDTPSFKLSTLTNATAAYADTLAALSTKLTYDPIARQQCVDELGIKGWRKRRLMLEFETALVQKGWLERWDVVLEVR
ncbi:uncharacterized protein BJ212DRAFT_1313501 [Suillus subaureus]|uniref:Uncharacterized protein n=1 Tax=Suillus subaureus TaxID=48587 RepID=A0A9P7EQQ6_9AGAM|nr:uncharacterized protein BJ212DRAFT_1313501 [Suillus subaureus]KAG1827611.1 hypothetical protein BJ212DRAFT_1313501 [Suillus subaureus]